MTKDAQLSNETVVRPIKVASPGNTVIKERINQPNIKLVEDSVKIMRGADRVENLPDITKPVQYSEEIIDREYQQPNQALYFQPVYEKQVIYNNEDVEFVPTEDQLMNLRPLAKQPIVRDNFREEIITKPGKEIYQQRIFQPVVQREKVNVEINRGDDKEIILEPVVEPVQTQNVTRVEEINVPGRQVISQPIVQAYYQQNDIYHVQNPQFERVPITRAVPVPTPSINKLPVRRQIPVPIPDPNAKGNTEVINETNVQVIGYATDKKEKVEEPVSLCPNCRRKTVSKVYGRGSNQKADEVVVKKSYEGIDKYWY